LIYSNRDGVKKVLLLRRPTERGPNSGNRFARSDLPLHHLHHRLHRVHGRGILCWHRRSTSKSHRQRSSRLGLQRKKEASAASLVN
jgi:hypothetical protein